jgi:hypothetical protein
VDPRLGRLAPALAGVAILAVSLARAQEGADNAAPTIVAPPAAETPRNATVPAPPPTIEAIPEAAPAPRAEQPAPPPAIPAGPPPPVRSPTAVLRVLDKVTAETLRFEAPVGRRVRYKTLVFMVKACETRGLKDPQPRPSAYLVIDFEPPAPPGRPAPEAKEIYRGWMFALAPGLHPFEHPVYDAWLESCTSDAPPA